MNSVAFYWAYTLLGSYFSSSSFASSAFFFIIRLINFLSRTISHRIAYWNCNDSCSLCDDMIIIHFFRSLLSSIEPNRNEVMKKQTFRQIFVQRNLLPKKFKWKNAYLLHVSYVFGMCDLVFLVLQCMYTHFSHSISLEFFLFNYNWIVIDCASHECNRQRMWLWHI